MTKFVGNGLDLLNHNDSKEPVKYKIAGLTIFDCLLDVNDEIMPERRIEIANHIGKVLETDKLPLMVNEIILRTASLSIGHFARVASTTEVEFLQNYFYPLAMKLIGDRRSDSHRFAGALILTQLAHFSPALIFSKRKVLFNVIWEAVCDKNKTVRAAAATSLEASLQVISQREAMSDYVKSALKQIDIGFTSTTSSSTAEKILGSLIILDTLMSGTIVTFTELYNTLRQQGVSVQDIIWKVIQRKDWSDADVRMKIIELIPNMAAAFSNTFVQPNSYTAPHSFLSYSLRHYMDLILARKERESCYNAIGRLFIALPSFFKNSPNISDIFNAITSGFKDPFCIHALSCMGALVNTSAYSRRFIDNKVIDLMFRGGLTIQLIDALKIIIKHIPGIRPYAQSKLKQAAAGILSKYTVSIDEKRSGSNAKTPTTATPKEPPSRSWFSSSRSSTVQEIPVATAAVVSAEKMEEEVVFALEVLAMTEFYPKVRDRAATSMSFTRMSGDGKSFASSMLPFASGNATTTGTSGTNSTSFPHPPLHPSTVLSGAQQQSSSLAQPSGIVSLNPPSNTAEEHEAIELLSIMRESVLRYLDDFSPRIRQAAMHACATVLNTVLPMIDLASTSHFYLSHQILDRLLIMGVGDDSCLIRQKVFTSFTPALDRLLSLTDNVHCLIEGLNDEILQVRVAAMTVLGRVAHFDSLHVLPTVRLVLKRLIFTLNTSQDSRVKLESVQLLQALVKGMETLIIPYVKQILDPLMALLSHHVTDIVVVALSTIGDLALSSHENVREHLDELAPRLIDVLNDESSIVKQETAVVALGKFVSSLTTVTEEPYKRYDGLFEGLVKATQNVDESSNELRLQAIKTLGLLGAVDTEVYQKHLMKSNAAVLNPQPEESGDAIDGNNNSDDEDYGKEKEDGMMMMILGQGNARRAAPPGNMTSPSQHYPPPSSNYASQKEEDPRVGKIERYYFSVVIRGLMTILRDNGLTFYHQTAITTAIRAIRMIGNRADCELNEVISAIVFRLFTDSGNNIKDALLDHLITLIHILGKSMVRHSRILVRIIQEFLRSHLQLCLDIFESMGSIFPTSDFNVILKDVFPMLLAMMEEEAFLSSPGSGNLGISLLPNGEDVYVVDGNAKQQSGYLMAASTSDRLHLPRNRNSLNASAGAAASAAVASNAALANPTPSNASGTSANAATTGVNGSSATGSGSGVVKSGNSGAKTSKIMQKLVNMNEVLGEYRRDSLPFLISLFGSELLSWEVKREVVCTLLCLSNENDLLEYSGRIIHALLRLLTDLTNSSAVLAGTSSSSTTGATTNAELALFNTIFNALSTFVCRLGTGFLPYVIPIRRKIRSIPMLSKYDLLNGGISLSASASSSSGSSQGRLVRLEEYEVLVTRLLKNRPLPNEPPDSSDLLCRVDERVRNRATTTRIYRDRENSTQQINMTNLETAWALSGRNNASDLIQWMGRLTIELIRQSPSPILRSCATLAKTYRPLAEELFNTSFHSIWEELFQNQYSQEIITDIPLITGMEIALESNQIPKNIMIALLNLAEFMDMQDQRLPIDMELLARRAQDANMFAKCLRFREIQFSSKNMVPSFECIDGMVSINNQLGLPDRAIGILRYLRLKYPMIEIQPRWLEKLLRYEDAYMAYEQDIATCKTLFGGGAGAEDHRVANPFKYERWINSELGRLRCLHALGEMDELAYHAEQLKNWLIAYKDEKEKAAVGSGHGAAAASTATDGEAAVLSPVMIAEIQKLGAHAAWRLGNWEKMEEFLDDTLLGSTEGNALATAATASSPAMPNMIEIIRHVDPKDVVLEHNIVFYHTILAIHQRDYHKALSFIHEIRSTLSGAIAALLSESYSRAYRAMVTMQTLAELEEVVEYKCCIAKANLDSEKVAMPIITDLTNEAAPNGSLALNLETTFASNVNGIASVAGAESSSGGAAATGGGSGASEKGVDLAVKKAALLDKWKARLKWAPKDIEVYRSILVWLFCATDMLWALIITITLFVYVCVCSLCIPWSPSPRRIWIVGLS